MIKFKVILVLMFFSISSIARTEVLYSYSGWLVGEKYYVSQADDGELLLNFGGDSIGNVTQCEEESVYFCFFSWRLAFVVPKVLSESTTSWEVEGFVFEVIDSDISVNFFGRSIDDLFLIRTPSSATLAGRQHEKDTYWLYSKTNGIIGFGFRDGSKVYWLEQEKGLGSSE